MKPTINWCAFCENWVGNYTHKCQFCDVYDPTIPPSKFTKKVKSNKLGDDKND